MLWWNLSGPPSLSLSLIWLYTVWEELLLLFHILTVVYNNHCVQPHMGILIMEYIVCCLCELCVLWDAVSLVILEREMSYSSQYIIMIILANIMIIKNIIYCI